MNPTENSKKLAETETHNTPTTKEKTTSKNPLYLNKPLVINPYKTKKIRKMKDHGRKHKTYVKVKFAKITTDSMAEQQEELSMCFNNIMNKVWNIDTSALILAWKDDMGTTKPLRQNSDFPKSKDQMLRYVDRLWIEKSKSAYARMIINHDLDPSKLFSDEALQLWLDDNDLSLQTERIQATKTACAGHLLRYHALACNMENLVDAIEQQALMKGINVEVRAEFIILGNPKNIKKKIKERTKIKILTLYVAWNRTADARHALVKIYSSKTNGSFPLGVRARFIPDTMDTRFVRTSAQVLAYKNSLRKHIKFMESSRIHPSYNIIELDHYLPKMRMTLRQAIMHIFSSSKPEWNLFLSVDTSFYGDCVIFSFRSELQEEAINMISALPLFLEASTGKQAVWNWFTRDARNEAALYTWDLTKGIIPNSELDCTDTQLENWEELDDIDDIEEPETAILQPFKLDLDSIGINTYGDAGTIVTDALIDRKSEEEDDQSADGMSVPPYAINVASKSKKPPATNDNSTVITEDTSTTPTVSILTPSTLTQTPEVLALMEALSKDPTMIEAFAAMMLKNNSNEGTSMNTGAGKK